MLKKTDPKNIEDFWELATEDVGRGADESPGCRAT